MNIGSIERAKDGVFGTRRAVIIYTQGCDLRCAYCGYAGLLGSCETSSNLDWPAAERYLQHRLDRIEGVIFSGGEPTLQEDLAHCLARVRSLGLDIMLETNGTRPEVLRELMAKQLVDSIAMDVKAPLDNYLSLVGRRLDPEVIRTSIWVIKQSGIDHEFRTTVVPGLHTTRELKAIAELVHGAQRYVVQDFISEKPLRSEYRGRPAFPHKPLEDIRAYVERRVGSYEIRHEEGALQMPTGRRRARNQAVAVG
jgi:pyruvate formate lyase activating enzyme